MPRLLLVLLTTALLAGCATAYQPRRGTVWSYIGTSKSVPGLRVISYFPERTLCEASLAKDRDAVTKENVAWAQLSPGDCNEAILVPGTDYWMFSYTAGEQSGLGLGGNTLEFCETVRNAFKDRSPSTCSRMSVRFLGRQ